MDVLQRVLKQGTVRPWRPHGKLFGIEGLVGDLAGG